MSAKRDVIQKRADMISHHIKQVQIKNEEMDSEKQLEKKLVKRVLEPKNKPSDNKPNDRKRHIDDDFKKPLKTPKIEPHSNEPGIKSQMPMSGSFAIQARLIMFLKERFLKKETDFMTLDEILSAIKETPSNDIVKQLKTFLNGHVKIEIEDDCFRFKPRYAIKNKDNLLNIVKTRFAMGLTVLQDDVLESHRNGANFIKKLINEKEIYSFETKREHKVILTYKDKDVMHIDPELDITNFKNLFSVTKIENHERDKYKRDGKSTIKTDGSEVVKTFKKSSSAKTKTRKKNTAIRTNQNLAHLLE